MMATSMDKTDFAAATAPPSDHPPDTPPGPNDIPASKTTLGMDKDFGKDSPSGLPVDKPQVGNLKILYLKNVPVHNNYESIDIEFRKFGVIREIRMKVNSMNIWDAWISFDNHAAAIEANMNLNKLSINESKGITASLCDQAPKNLEVYKPMDWIEKPKERSLPAFRAPKPPSWIIATGNNDKYNYYKMSKCIQRRVGSIKSSDISRYGRQSVLIHAKSDTQAIMLCSMKITDNDIVKEIKPHINFSYGRGVLFDRDLYEFSEEEILEMCPSSVWKISKVPGTSMIIVSFETPNVPDHICIENERVRIREYKPKPMQCFSCFGFGHHSKFCKNDKVCVNCSALAHGECKRDSKCVNCNLAHKANDKVCNEYKNEETALLKASAEHISVGYAKKLLGRQLNYAKAVKVSEATATSSRLNSSTPSGKGSPSDAEAQDSRSGAKPPEAEAHSSRKDNNLPSSQAISQAESLPDLMDIDRKQMKRLRTPSSSPPSTPNKNISLTNKFEVLDKLKDNNENKEQPVRPKSKDIKMQGKHTPSNRETSDKNQKARRLSSHFRSNENMSQVQSKKQPTGHKKNT